MKKSLFSSVEALREQFINGLDRLLESKDASPKISHFILVAANAFFDQVVYEQTLERLQRNFEQLRNKTSFLSNSEIEADQLVFLKLLSLSWERISLVERKKVGKWDVQFNQLRSLRPSRQTGEKITSLWREFNPSEFHFNKPFLRPERFWKGEIAKKEVVIFYNKFPFLRFHLNLVPDCNAMKPQFLKKEDHQSAWNIAQEFAGLNGFGIGYNSFGTFASVNHLHFQMFADEMPLPVMDRKWQHNGGWEEYPAKCIVFDSINESWQWLKKIHNSQGIAYNVLYVPNKMFCFPRKFQRTYQQPSWTSGFAWYELSGGFITFNRKDYDTIRERDIVEAFKNLTV